MQPPRADSPAPTTRRLPLAPTTRPLHDRKRTKTGDEVAKRRRLGVGGLGVGGVGELGVGGVGVGDRRRDVGELDKQLACGGDTGRENSIMHQAATSIA